MPQDWPIDAHCHLFNVFYLTREMAEILWDTVWGSYPRRTEALKAIPGVCAEGALDWLKGLKDQISQLSQSAFGSYEDNFNLLTRAYQQTFETDEKLIMYPLMMDIHYMAAKPCSPYPKPEVKEAGVAPAKNPKQLFDELFNELKTAIVQRAREVESLQLAAPNAASTAFSPDDVGQKLDAIYNEVSSPSSAALRAAAGDGIELSGGFAEQVRELMDLRQAHPDTIFPFFAVDPRRAGIMDVITKGSPFLSEGIPLVGRNGPFFGVKLYPRLGYLPLDVDTECPGLYKWCQDNEIPITIHCSMTGFPPGPNAGCGGFGDPANWKGVLDAYPGLRINLAHFGNNGAGWKETIINLMKRTGNNVYTDLACFTEEAKLRDAQSALTTCNALKGRLMFGTDFDVMLTTDFVTLGNYFEQFKTVFSPGQMADMSRRVPSLFLNRG